MSLYSAALRKLFLPAILKRDNYQAALEHWRFYEESQYWPRARLLEYQWQQAHKLITHAYEKSPYYQKLFAERQLTPASFQSISDLTKLPPLSRDDLYHHMDDVLVAGSDKKKLQSFVSGGTTIGQRVVYYRDHYSWWVKGGMAWRHEGWMGRQPCDKLAFFWPAHIDLGDEQSWKERLKERWFLRTQMYNGGFLPEEVMRGFHRQLQSFRPKYFKVFPGAFTIFTEFLDDHDLHVPGVKGIMSTGEALYDFQRELFERVWECPVYDMYGSREAGNNACECSTHEGMHVAMETTLIEFVVDGQPVAPGTEGEMLITDLTNFAMPLIRYRINDRGIPLGAACSCGRELDMIGKAIGRITDDFWGRDGQRHPGYIFGIHFIENAPPIGQIQTTQLGLDKFHVRITDKPVPTQEVFDFIQAKFAQLLGGGLTVTIEVVKEIPREKSGKVRLCKCDIDPPPNARYHARPVDR